MISGVAGPRVGGRRLGRPGGTDERRKRFPARSRRFRRPGGIGASLRRLSSYVPFRLVAGTARVAAARRPSQRRQAVHLRAMRPTLPLPLRLRETPGAEPSGPLAGRQALHLRRLRHAVQVPQVVQEAPAEPRAGTTATCPGAAEQRDVRVSGGGEERPGVQHRGTVAGGDR